MNKIKEIPVITSAVPKEIARVLVPMKQAIDALKQNAVSVEAGFNGSVLKVVLGSGVLDKVPQQDLEPVFEQLRDLTRQAQMQVESIRDPIRVNADMAFDALGQSQRNLADIVGLSNDLADQADDLAQQALDLLNLATDVDLLQTTVGGLEDDFLATSTLLDATVSRVDANEDSIDVITAAITSLQAELVDTTAFDPGIVWQFEGSVDGWTSNFTLTTNDYFISVPDDSGTYIRSPSGIAIDGRLYTRIISRIRRTAGTGWLGRASYATSGGSAHGIDTTNFQLTLSTEPVFAGGGWVIVVWDMEILTAGGTDWVDNIIDQIQLELSDDAATEFDVDWVAIGRVAPSFFSGSLSALTSRVTATEDAITALSSDVTSLESRATDLEDFDLAISTAVDTLSTRVTATEDSIDTQSSQITSLTSRVDDAEDDISSTSTALSALTTRVTDAEGVNTSQAASITTLTSGLASANTAISSNATAITGLDTRVTATEGTNTSQSSAITTLQNTVNDGTTGVAATAAGLSALTTRVTTAEGSITSNTSSITSLNSQVSNPSTGLVANANAISALQTTVTQQGGTISTQAQQVTLLQVRQAEGPSLINPLTSAGNSQDWDVPAFGVLPGSDVFLVNVGGRNKTAARIRTDGSVQRVSRMLEIDQSAIYEVRFSILKTLAHGYMYFGIAASNDGVTYDNVACTPIQDRAVSGGSGTNQYLFFNPRSTPFGTNHANFNANQWYDVVSYIVGANAQISRVPAGTINGTNRTQGFSPIIDGETYLVDGVQLGAAARFVQLRFLNFYNSTQTDLFCNNITIRKIYGRDAGIDQEIADRTAAVQSEQTARISGDSALAQSITTVQSGVNGNTASISSLQSSVNGISAQWVLQLNVNNRITGLKLAGSETATTFSVLADQFSVALPGSPGATPVVPFTVGNVNGVPTVGITGNLIVDGTIFTRNLQNGSVTTAKIPVNAISRGNIALGISPSFAPSQSITVCSNSYTIGDSNGRVRIDWALSIFHSVNSDPAGKIGGFMQVRRNGLVITSRTFSLNSRNFTGEVYPPYVRSEFYNPIFAAGDLIEASITVTTSGAVNNAFSVSNSFIAIEESMR